MEITICTFSKGRDCKQVDLLYKAKKPELPCYDIMLCVIKEPPIAILEEKNIQIPEVKAHLYSP